MRLSALKYATLTWVSNLAMVIIFLVPFQGFLTVFGAHLLGHYTLLRLWDEALLLLSVVGIIYLLLTDKKIRYSTLYRRLVWLIFCYIGLNVLLGLIAYKDHNVSSKALGYGLIINLRYPIFFLVTWSVALRIGRIKNRWQGLIIWPAVAVVVFGLLQIFVLPHDFLTHFGYNLQTIPAFETINHNSKYMRIASTLRGANPLGAYLILPISLLSVLLLRSKKRDWKYMLLLLGSIVVLFYSFSRSAWAGATLSVAFILFNSDLAKKHAKQLLGASAGLIVVLGLVFAFFHNSQLFQNYVYHTQDNSSIKTTSDGQHSSALKTGLHDVLHEPLGRGPGTSGPASIYNNNPRDPEDYYLQIGEEDGWLGLVVFVLITLGVGYILWLKKDDPLSLFLLASLIGITLVNFLLFAWSDDTLSYIWWGLAGLAMAPEKVMKKEKI